MCRKYSSAYLIKCTLGYMRQFLYLLKNMKMCSPSWIRHFWLFTWCWMPGFISLLWINFAKVQTIWKIIKMSKHGNEGAICLSRIAKQWFHLDLLCIWAMWERVTCMQSSHQEKIPVVKSLPLLFDSSYKVQKCLK